MDCQIKNCKYYRKKERKAMLAGVDISGGGYCSKGYCEKQFRRKESRFNMVFCHGR